METCRLSCSFGLECDRRSIGLFQKQYGLDMMMFVLFVHEYDLKCRKPNNGRVVINYVDSLNYYKPRK